MRVIVMVKATEESEAGALPSEAQLREMARYNEELAKAGILLAAESLYPSSDGRRVRFSGAQRTVTRGPFGQTGNLLAGFWLWRVESMEEALEWAERCPNPMPGRESEIEIRKLFEAEDFARSAPQGELPQRQPRRTRALRSGNR